MEVRYLALILYGDYFCSKYINVKKVIELFNVFFLLFLFTLFIIKNIESLDKFSEYNFNKMFVNY